jgi:hypothetical protein
LAVVPTQNLRSDKAKLPLWLPIIRAEGGDEEGDIHQHENRKGAPPRINPGKGRGAGQKDLKNGEKGGIMDYSLSVKFQVI